MSRKKLQKNEKKISPFWERVIVLCDREHISETRFRKITGLSSSYLSELKYGRSIATGGDLWLAIKRKFPQWEDYLRDIVKNPPQAPKSARGGTILTGHTQTYPETPEDIGVPHGDSDSGSYGVPDFEGYAVRRVVTPADEWYYRAMDTIFNSNESGMILTLKTIIRELHAQIKDRDMLRRMAHDIDRLKKEIERTKNTINSADCAADGGKPNNEAI